MNKKRGKGGAASVLAAAGVALALILIGSMVLTYGDPELLANIEFSLLCVLIVGAAFLVFSVYGAIAYAKRESVRAFGRKTEAEYLKMECKSSTSSREFYSVTYGYDVKGTRITAQSPAVYSWSQALALKFEGRFEVTVKGRSGVITADADALAAVHAAEIEKYKAEWIAAYRKLHGAG